MPVICDEASCVHAVAKGVCCEIVGKFAHVRDAYDVASRDTVRPDRDTIYSWSVFELTSPLTSVLPDPEGSYQSLMIVGQDHYTWAEYGPKELVLDEKTVGTRYALLLVRTFLAPNDEADVKTAHALQDPCQLVPLSAWGKPHLLPASVPLKEEWVPPAIQRAD